MVKNRKSDGINLLDDAELSAPDVELRSSCFREKKLHIEHEVGISEIYRLRLSRTEIYYQILGNHSLLIRLTRQKCTVDILEIGHSKIR